MKREEAHALIREHVKNENSVKHMLAVEAVMRALARRLEEDEEKWGLAGLLHDIDMETVDHRTDPQRHGIEGARILEEKGVEEDIVEAVKAHNEATGKERNTLMEKAIYAADPLTGLIIASVLVLPNKKLEELSVDSVMKRFKEKDFARGADRDTISSCEELGIPLEEFVKIGLRAMREINEDLGL